MLSRNGTEGVRHESSTERSIQEVMLSPIVNVPHTYA